ncbi:MAG: hypothetical protein NWQ38_06205 [Cellulophaga sp.]|nr:hypothetical protein [Cellulophaga sp.]
MKQIYTVKKEIIYLIVTLLLGYFLNVLFFGKNALSFSQTLNINIYDTYFVFQSFAVLIFIIVLTIFLLYLVRTIWFRFQNNWANIIAVVATIAMLVSVDSLVSMIDSFAALSLENIVGSLSNYTDSSKEMSAYLNNTSLIAKIFQACLLLILVFFSFKIGSNNSK